MQPPCELVTGLDRTALCTAFVSPAQGCLVPQLPITSFKAQRTSFPQLTHLHCKGPDLLLLSSELYALASRFYAQIRHRCGERPCLLLTYELNSTAGFAVHLLPFQRDARFKGLLVSQRTRKGKMINRLSCIVVTVAFLMGAIAQAQAQTSEVCSGIDCQQGTCVPLSNTSYPSNILSPYQCTCNPGWQTLEGLLANLPHVLTLPCTVPNCTLNLDCGGAPAPVQAPLTLEHVSSPCSLPGICGRGECVVTDLTKYPPMYKCSCQPGYENVGNLSAGYCLKDCEVGSNCRAIGISLPSKSAGSWEASVVSSFKITVAVVSASVSLSFFL